MKAVKNRLGIFILILALLSIGVPVFNPTDINRDMRTDLQDLILSVRKFTGSVDESSGFRSEFAGAVAALRIVSGLETEIRPERGNGPLKSGNFQNIQIFDSSEILHFSSFYSSITEPNTFYKSIHLLMDTPPPKQGLSC